MKLVDAEPRPHHLGAAGGGERRRPTRRLADDDPGQAVVFGDGFPREGGRARFTPARVTPPAEVPDADYPFVLTTGRQLEHWHTGSMTRRASVLDALEPEATCSLHPATLRRLGVPPGGTVRLTTRRGSVALKARADRAVAEDMVFIPFAYVEAAANILTNPVLDPCGKIPEFKFARCGSSRLADPRRRVCSCARATPAERCPYWRVVVVAADCGLRPRRQGS